MVSLNTRCFEPWGALCSYNERSDVVWRPAPRLDYKDFAGTKPACVRNESRHMVKGGSSMSEVRPVPPGLQFAAFVGIDWADQKHAWCLQAAGSDERESGELEHTPEAVEACGSALSTIRLRSHRGGDRAIAGSSGVHGNCCIRRCRISGGAEALSLHHDESRVRSGGWRQSPCVRATKDSRVGGTIRSLKPLLSS